MTAAPDVGPSAGFLAVAGADRRELTATMVRGDRPDPRALAGWEYRGLNTAWWLRSGGIDRFVKGFRASVDGWTGYNRRVPRGDRRGPWLTDPPTDGPPFAPFAVVEVDPESRDNRYLNALLLDYGRGGSARLDPSRPLRDYVVRVEAGSDDVLLGAAFAAIGGVRLPVTIFVLERLRLAPA